MSKRTQKRLLKLDEFTYQYLIKNVNVMPMRFVKWIANYYTDARVRKQYLKRLGVEMGENTYSNLGFRVVSDDTECRVLIGKNVSIAPNVTFIVSSDANNGQKINEIPYVRNVLTKQGKIVVEDEVWIGANVTVLPDVHIGTCSVIGAGAVVTQDVEVYSVYAGVPAKKIRSLRETE